MQSLQDDCESWETLPPGHFYTSDMPRGQYQRYYDPPYWSPDHIPTGRADHMLVRGRGSADSPSGLPVLLGAIWICMPDAGG